MAGPRNGSIWAAFAGMGAALVAATTLVVQIPVPATQGYINLGDTMVIALALALGPTVGAFCGGVGSALADLLSGYAHYAPYTLAIKGVEGALAGLVSGRGRWAEVAGATVAVAEMVLGYFTVEAILLGPGAAVAELPGNLFQAAVGVLVGVPLSRVLRAALSRWVS